MLAKARLAQIDGEIKVAGLKRAGAGGARYLGRAAHLGAVGRRPLLRAGLRHGPGPSVADGDVAARRGRAHGGDRRARRWPAIASARLLKYRGPFDDSRVDQLPSRRASASSRRMSLASMRSSRSTRTACRSSSSSPGSSRNRGRSSSSCCAPPSFGDAASRAAARAQRRAARRRTKPTARAIPTRPTARSFPAASTWRQSPTRSSPRVARRWRRRDAARRCCRHVSATSDRPAATTRQCASRAATTGSSSGVAVGDRPSRSSPTIRIAKSRIRRCATSSISRRPGWNVVGAGEPPFVGVAIGHNERVAWGLTIVGTDQEDVYVEAGQPGEPERGAVQRRVGAAEDRQGDDQGERCRRRRRRTSRSAGTGQSSSKTRSRHLAYAVRRAAAEPGTAPYLAGLRLAPGAGTAASSSTRRCTGRRRPRT